VTVVSRNDGGWDTHEYRASQQVEVPALTLGFSGDELYAGINLIEA